MATEGVFEGQIVGRGWRGPRPARRRGGRVLAAAGDGWALWVPVDQWERMTNDERADLAASQLALLEGGQSAASRGKGCPV